MIGVWTHLADSLKDFVESIKAMVDAVGIDHVGIGSDTYLLSRVGQGAHRAWLGLTGGFFHAVVGDMLVQGFTPDEIARRSRGICSSADLSWKRGILSSNQIVISTGAYPDFLPRSTGQGRVCAFL